MATGPAAPPRTPRPADVITAALGLPADDPRGATAAAALAAAGWLRDTPAAHPGAGTAGLWDRRQVLDYLDSAGSGVAPDTWSGYVTRGQAPAPARRVGRTPLWDPAEVRAWQTGRAGKGWRAGHAEPGRPTLRPAPVSEPPYDDETE